LTKYLAETGENSSLAGIIVISTIWNGVESMTGLERFPNRQLYSWALSRSMREKVRRLVVASIFDMFKIELDLFRHMPKILSKFSVLPYDFEEILKVCTCTHSNCSIWHTIV